MGAGGKKKLGATWVSEFIGRQQLNVLSPMPIVVHVGDDVIGPMVNKRVLVRALKPRTGALRFLDIELTADASRK